MAHTEQQAVPPPAARARRRRAWPLIVLALAAAAVAVAVAVGAGVLSSDDDRVVEIAGPGGNATLEKPDAWSELSKSQLAKAPGAPLAVLRRDEGGGVVVVNRQGKPPGNLDQVSKDLDRRLKKSIPDFRKVSARRVRVKAGEALLYSYARVRRGSAHTLIVVPVPGGSYTLNAAVPAGDEEAARDVGRILLSFDA